MLVEGPKFLGSEAAEVALLLREGAVCEKVLYCHLRTCILAVHLKT